MILGILESSSGSLNGVFDRFEKYWFLVKIQLILGLHSKNSCKKSRVLISIYIFIMIFSILRFASRCKSVGVLFSCFLTTNIIINNYTHNIVNDIPWWLSVTRLMAVIVEKLAIEDKMHSVIWRRHWSSPIVSQSWYWCSIIFLLWSNITSHLSADFRSGNES